MSFKTEEAGTSSILHRQVADLVKREDGWWYSGMLDRSVCGRVLSTRERSDVARGCMGAADDACRAAQCCFEGKAPVAIAGALGLKVRRVKQDDLLGSSNILGLYDPQTAAVCVCEDTVASIERFIDGQGLNDLLGGYSIFDVALLHEIFHSLEDRTPGIYTRSRMLRRKILSFFPVRAGLDAASEVGAVHFSKLMSRLPFSPCIYTWLSLVLNGRVIPDAWRV
ncbi:MAG TPA: hypothetical protein DEP64_04125 [Ruminococcaceae bacterium]|jgi:hypothetical protein|nr:hypothetical protein [Oscillospiraceae bacterium]